MNSKLFILLFPLYLIYLCVIYLRNFLYNKNILNISKLPCKVINVGNISMGGTGKTPTVISLAQQLQKRHTVAILSRGYGRKSKGTLLVTNGKSISTDWNLVGDEPALMASKLNEIPIVVDENRARGGKYLIDKFNPDIIILDDAFQHRKIYRDLDIVLIDASKPYKRTFLREPISSIKRAHIIFLTKGDESNTKSLKDELSKKYVIPIHRIKTLTEKTIIDRGGNSINIKKFKNKDVLIFSGIGNSKSFYETVELLGMNIAYSIDFKDHHKYLENDIEKIKSALKKSGAEMILTTEKDIIKLPLTDLPIYAIQISMKLPERIIDFIDKKLY